MPGSLRSSPTGLRRPGVLPERRGRARLPGGLAAHPGPAERRRPLLDRRDRGRVHGWAGPGQPRWAACASTARDRRRARSSCSPRASSASPPSAALSAPSLRLALVAPRLALRGAAARRRSSTSRRSAVPTVLMGMSLPFLTRGHGARTRSGRRDHRASSTASTSWARPRAPWPRPGCFVRHHGIAAPRSGPPSPPTCVAGLCALALALRAAARARGGRRRRREPRARHCPGGTDGSGAGSRSMPSSGFCALALEMLWFRMIEVSVKSTALHVRHAAGRCISFGSGVGAIAGIALAPRDRRPAARLPGLPVPAARLRLRRDRAAASGCRRTLRSTPGSTTCGAAAAPSTWAAMALGALLRLYVVLPARTVRSADRPHGPVVSRSSSARCRTTRAPAAGRSACCRPPTSPAASRAACSWGS